VVKISNPDRVYFSARGETKLDLARYYLSVADGIVNALYHRPCMLHRFPDGVTGRRCTRSGCRRVRRRGSRPSGCTSPRFNRDADELCVSHPADVIWAVQMSTVEFHPWNSRRDDVEVPRRVADRPGSRCPSPATATCSRWRSSSRSCWPSWAPVGYPKTSGGKGLHIYVRIVPEHGHPTYAERPGRSPARSSAGPTDSVDLTWWRKDRDPGSVFVDYNQNARDHTIACAYSVRGTPLGMVSAPVRWDEIADADPRDFTIATMPARFAADRGSARRHRRPSLPAGHPAGVGGPGRTRERRRTGGRRLTGMRAELSKRGRLCPRQAQGAETASIKAPRGVA
jgi:DNA ligase D-like protein (predicted polymerase)